MVFPPCVFGWIDQWSLKSPRSKMRADEADIGQLRSLLKSAQNDVKRYAAHIIRLQHELDRERLKNGDRTKDAIDTETAPLHVRDEKVDGVAHKSASMAKTLEQLWRKMAADCAVCHRQHTNAHAPDATDGSVSDQVCDVTELITLQRQQLLALARENVKLRDALETRPSHRELAQRQWQIERLETQLSRLNDQRRAQPVDLKQQQTAPPGPVPVPVHKPWTTETLTDRISVDKLLSWLHVETKTIKSNNTTSLRRRFLKEPVECYLVLDAAALLESSSSSSSPSDNMKKREHISRRVGILCSEIVASCCHSLGISTIATLPQHVKAMRQSAQIVPLLHDFVDRVDALTKAAAVVVQPHDERRGSHEPSDQGLLNSLTARVQDLVFEVRARREQMKPPGDKALAAVLRCMKLVRADHIDQLSSTIEKLIESTRCEKEFLRDVRKLMGLDIAAPRSDVLALITQLLDQVGLSPASSGTSLKSKAPQSTASVTHRRHSTARVG